jgi:hypothetical protein
MTASPWLPLAVLVLLSFLSSSIQSSSALFPVLEHDFLRDLTPFDQVRGRPYSVTVNGRAIAINGANVFLQSGSIHYPRSTSEMWPHLMANARAGGLNMVQVYVYVITTKHRASQRDCTHSDGPSTQH